MAKPPAISPTRWLILLLVPLAWCLAEAVGLLTVFEQRSLDWRFRLRGERTAPVKLLYVDVDSPSLSAIGGWPWSRHYLAVVAEALVAPGRARAVGVDFVLSDQGLAESADRERLVEGNLELARFLFRDPPVVLAASFSAAAFYDERGRLITRELPRVGRDLRRREEIEPPEGPVFATHADPAQPRPWSPPRVGLIDTWEGGTRTVPAYAPTAVRTYHHLSVELARLYWGLPEEAIQARPRHLELRAADGSTHARIPLRDRQWLDVNWFSRWESPTNPRISFVDVYQYAQWLQSTDPEERQAAETFFAQEALRDAVVLIGPVDPLLQDLATTPFDDVPVPRVGIHGNLLKTIVSGEYLRWWPAGVGHGLTVALSLATAGLALRGGGRWKLLAAGLPVAYTGVVVLAFVTGHWVGPLVAPLGAALTTGTVGVAWQLAIEERQKSRIKGMFGTYVSPQLVERLVETGENPQLGGHEQEITAFFSDIQGFSTMAERLPSGPLVELMNEYLTACTDLITQEGGTLDKYIGDAVVAMFGAPVALPDHAYRACVVTQRIQLRLAELREKWRREGGRWPETVWHLRSRIGVNTGVATIGNMGSRSRFNYTMMGDSVNLAARLESGAKRWGVYSLCSGMTREAAEWAGDDPLVFRPLGRVVVVGRTQPVPIFEIMGFASQLTPAAREGLEAFVQALRCYEERDWERAIQGFQQSARLEPLQPDPASGLYTNPSLVFLALARRYQQQAPPREWDGAYVMEEK